MNDESLAQRFWNKVDRSRLSPGGCWLWTAAVDGGRGYGVIQIKRKAVSAHRVAYELEYGAIPAGPGYHGMCVCHRCDNVICVNPAHLFLDTAAGNIADRDSKLRQARGEKNGRSILTVNQVREIRQRAVNEQQNSLAISFGVSPQQINSIVKRRSWTHV